jgi:hypothetical protein
MFSCILCGIWRAHWKFIFLSNSFSSLSSHLLYPTSSSNGSP